MSALYLPGFEAEQRRRDLSQFFTPPWLAERAWRWVLRPAARPLRILEPSAGNGALIRPLRTLGVSVHSLVVYEIDPVHVGTLATLVASQGLPAVIHAESFLADPAPGRFDACVMNPPYEDDQDTAFLEHALKCCPRVVGILRAGILFGQARHDFWRWHDIRRQANCSARPDFGGADAENSKGAKGDYVVLELERRRHARKQGEASTVNVEWWLEAA